MDLLVFIRAELRGVTESAQLKHHFPCGNRKTCSLWPTFCTGGMTALVVVLAEVKCLCMGFLHAFMKISTSLSLTLKCSGSNHWQYQAVRVIEFRHSILSAYVVPPVYVVQVHIGYALKHCIQHFIWQLVGVFA